MVKRMVVEIERDPALYPESNIVEVLMSACSCLRSVFDRTFFFPRALKVAKSNGTT